MAVRPYLVAELDESITQLAQWTQLSSERLRRFACESIRPRGVWCSHIAVLKQNPERALAVLEPLRADPAVYVQDSVGNWLNDAGKDRPDWVRTLCKQWLADLPDNPNTKRITSRAGRSLS
jgi:3-methyladenine DNA glycosylase AlkC